MPSRGAHGLAQRRATPPALRLPGPDATRPNGEHSSATRAQWAHAINRVPEDGRATPNKHVLGFHDHAKERVAHGTERLTESGRELVPDDRIKGLSDQIAATEAAASGHAATGHPVKYGGTVGR